MNFPDNLLPHAMLWTGNALALLLMVVAVCTAPWKRLAQVDLLNVWLGMCVGLMLIWSIKTGIKPGLNFHLLGATLMTLMFGPQLAMIGLALVLLAVTLAGMSGWSSYALNLLLMGALPVLLSHRLYVLAERNLPHHLFVYILLDAFFGAALAMALSGLTSTLLLAFSRTYPYGYLTDNYLPYYILMSWSEALLTGMAVTLMTAFRPHWLSTFDDLRYLGRKS
jgi:uncharacterized membrane protein